MTLAEEASPSARKGRSVDHPPRLAILDLQTLNAHGLTCASADAASEGLGGQGAAGAAKREEGAGTRFPIRVAPATRTYLEIYARTLNMSLAKLAGYIVDKTIEESVNRSGRSE